VHTINRLPIRTRRLKIASYFYPNLEIQSGPHAWQVLNKLTTIDYPLSLLRCDTYSPRENIAHTYGTHHLLIRHSWRRLLHHYGHSQGRACGRVRRPRITREEADKAGRNSPVTYLFGLGDGSVVIDGQCTAMYISTTVATPTARPARKSPTITASMIAAPKTAKSCAAAARPLAAEPCTRRKKFAAVMLPPAGLQEIVGAHWQIVEFWASFCPIDQGFTLNAT